MAHLATYTAVPTNLPQVISQNLEDTPFKLQTKLNNVNVFPKMFLWRKRKQFWQTCRFFLPKDQTILAHHPKTKRKKFLQFFPKWFLWTLTRQFRQSCSQIFSYNFEKLPPKIRKKQSLTKLFKPPSSIFSCQR